MVRAVNSLMRFSSEDQESLLEVIEDYFMLPSRSSVPDDVPMQDLRNMTARQSW